MLFGPDGVDYLTVVYGPAKELTWNRFASDLSGLAQGNGLWEAIVALSDGILVDSPTATGLADIGVVNPSKWVRTSEPPPPLPSATEVPHFGEHDVDTVLHSMFTNSTALGIFEGMCNPPGGDWSGISFQSSEAGEVLRWTSLPRVSGGEAKRPDHLMILYGPPLYLFAIESKDGARTVEPGIGPRLTSYVNSLFSVAPNIRRLTQERVWRPYTGAPVDAAFTVYSAAAFRYSGALELATVLQRGEVDAALGLEFIAGEERVLLHVSTRPAVAWLREKLAELAHRFGSRLEVQVH